MLAGNPNTVEEPPRYKFIYMLVNILIDRFVCAKPHLFGVGYSLYLIIAAIHVSIVLRDYVIGILNTSLSNPFGSLWWTLIGMSFFVVVIVLVGTAVVPQLDYRERGVRNIEYCLQSLLTRIIRDHRAGLRVSAKFVLYVLVIVNTVISAWLWYKFVRDVPFLIAFRKAAAGEPSGYIALALDVLQTSLLVLFWNISAVVFA